MKGLRKEDTKMDEKTLMYLCLKYPCLCTSVETSWCIVSRSSTLYIMLNRNPSKPTYNPGSEGHTSHKAPQKRPLCATPPGPGVAY